MTAPTTIRRSGLRAGSHGCPRMHTLVSTTLGWNKATKATARPDSKATAANASQIRARQRAATFADPLMRRFAATPYSKCCD